jgi:multiple sugar transport system permease protein
MSGRKVVGSVTAVGAPLTRRRQHSDGRVAFLFLLPNVAGFLLFILVPILATFGLSLFNWPLIRPPTFIGIENYIQLFAHDLAFGQVLLNTLYYVLVYVALNLVVSLTFAVWLSKERAGQGFFRAAFFLPVLVSPVAIALIWQWIYSPTYGLLNWILSFAGIHGPNWTGDTRWAMPSLILMSVWELFAYNMFIFIAGIQGIPNQLFEAAYLDGAGGWTRFWRITLPMISPIVFFGMTLTLITSFQTFDQVFVLTGGGPGEATDILGLFVYNNAFQYFKMGYGASVAVITFVLILVVTLIQFLAQNKWVYYESAR